MMKRRKTSQGEAQAFDAPPTSETIELGAATEDDEETAATPRRRPRRALIGVAVVAVVVILAVAGYMAWPDIETRLLAGRNGAEATPPTPRDAEIAMIETRVADIEAALNASDTAREVDDLGARLDAFDERLSALEATPRGAIDIGDIEDRFEAIEARIAEVTADVGGTAALAERIDAIERAAGDPAAAGALLPELERLAVLAADLEGRLATVETRAATPVTTQPAMLLAVGQLRAALRGSGPFDVELDALDAVVGNDAGLAEAVATLAAHAGRGVPTVAALRARFAGVAIAVVRAAGAPDAPTWVERTAARLAQLVTVRRVGDVPGVTAEAIVARAEQRLTAGDLAAAVDEIQRLEDPPAETAAAWLADARARRAVERALATLDARVVTAMSGAEGGG